MKFFLGLATILFCMNSIAAERSMTLFADNNFLGNYLDFYDDYHVREMPEVTNSTRLTDYLLPVGTNNTSSVQVTNGHCGILTSQPHFAGTWKVLNPGEHTSLGSFDNLTQSVATYKMIGLQQTTCDPKNDIPTLYSGTAQTGNVYPLVTANGYKAQGNLAGLVLGMIPLASNHRSAGTVQGGVFITGGGFSDKAQSLKVPACYSVRLSNLSIDRTFAPGSYNLSTYGLAKNVYSAQVTRQANCTQPKQTVQSQPQRIQNFWKSNQFLNIESGVIASSTIQPGWLSAMWTFEPLGNGFVQIRNRWKTNEYLNIETGVIRSSSILPLWWSAQWKLVEMRVGTTQVFRIQNRWRPDQYLHIENGVIQSGPILSGWHSSLWILSNI